VQHPANAATAHRVADDQEHKGDDGNNPKDVNGDPQTEEDGNQEEDENDWKHFSIYLLVSRRLTAMTN
jgi:hypothetical protein